MSSPLRNQLILAAAALGLASAAAPAFAQAPSPGRAEVLSQLIACRSISDTAQRLACFDQNAASLDAAERSGDVVVVDRAQVRETRRQLFGFSLPDVPIFDRGENPERIESVTSSLASARRLPDGKMRFELEDGSVWTQVDFDRFNGATRAGSGVEIRRASLGSYMLSVGGTRSVRVSRDR
jgi:hypothetical protein